MFFFSLSGEEVTDTAHNLRLRALQLECNAMEALILQIERYMLLKESRKATAEAASDSEAGRLVAEAANAAALAATENRIAIEKQLQLQLRKIEERDEEDKAALLLQDFSNLAAVETHPQTRSGRAVRLPQRLPLDGDREAGERSLGMPDGWRATALAAKKMARSVKFIILFENIYHFFVFILLSSQVADAIILSVEAADPAAWAAMVAPHDTACKYEMGPENDAVKKALATVQLPDGCALEEFTMFKIEHRPGSKNGASGSRMQCGKVCMRSVLVFVCFCCPACTVDFFTNMQCWYGIILIDAGTTTVRVRVSNHSLVPSLLEKS